MNEFSFTAQNKKFMQVVEIEENLMAEICKAANFEGKTCSEYINKALQDAVRSYRQEKKVSEMYEKAYADSPQELDSDDAEIEHWKKVYDKWEQAHR